MVSMIISWRNRIELAQALPSLLEEVENVGGELILVNYGGDEKQLDSQISAHRNRLRVVQIGGIPFFNKCAAHNIGAFYSDQPILFFCDCDILLPQGILASLIHRLEDHQATFLTLAGVTETEKNSRKAKHIVRFGYELNLKAANGRELRIVDHEEDAEDGCRQAPGLLILRKSHFLEINGYNSQLDGWGWEDQDMISRLTLGVGLTRISEGYVLHISHGDEARVMAYPYADRWASRDRMFRRALANYDDAHFYGTYTKDSEGIAR
jgi:predicted glycosyltransferase involved in capsule biosynthesis